MTDNVYEPDDWLPEYDDDTGSYDDDYDYDYSHDLDPQSTGFDYDPEENDWFYSDKD